MIEWVPIKDFVMPEDDKEVFLIAKLGDGHRAYNIKLATKFMFPKDYFLIISSHAAKINPPVEKTLEEKFEEFQYEQSWSVTVKELRQGFAQIAKEHYEGEK